MAAEDASFKTEIFSISIELIRAKSPAEVGIPSTKINGAPPLIEVSPRTLKEGTASADPPFGEICKFGTKPCKAIPTLLVARFCNIVEDTVSTAPLKLAFFCTPYPTTTNSSNASASSFMVMDKLVWFPILISWLLNPI